MALVDRITGEIIFSRIPFDTADGHSGALYGPRQQDADHKHRSFG